MVPVMIDPFKELRDIEKRISSMLEFEGALAAPKAQAENIWRPAVKRG